MDFVNQKFFTKLKTWTNELTLSSRKVLSKTFIKHLLLHFVGIFSFVEAFFRKTDGTEVVVLNIKEVDLKRIDVFKFYTIRLITGISSTEFNAFMRKRLAKNIIAK